MVVVACGGEGIMIQAVVWLMLTSVAVEKWAGGVLGWNARGLMWCSPGCSLAAPHKSDKHMWAQHDVHLLQNEGANRHMPT